MWSSLEIWEVLWRLLAWDLQPARQDLGSAAESMPDMTQNFVALGWFVASLEWLGQRMGSVSMTVGNISLWLSVLDLKSLGQPNKKQPNLMRSAEQLRSRRPSKQQGFKKQYQRATHALAPCYR